MSSSQDNLSIKMYPAPAGKARFVGQINFPETLNRDNDRISGSQGVETIVLLDCSGSMGQNVRRILTDYLPNALRKIGFDENDTIQLVSFESRSQISKYTVNTLRSSLESCRGCTYMAPGINNIGKLINASPHSKFRIIVISDGQLNDQREAIESSRVLANTITSRGCAVNCTAIRFYTSSYGDPDTRGLASILQLGTTNTNKFLVDVMADHPRDRIIAEFSELMYDDLGATSKLKITEPLMLSTPWANVTTEHYLSTGMNTLWFTDIPESGSMKIITRRDNKDVELIVNIEQGDKLDFNSYNTILKDKVEYFMRRLRILNVVNTVDAREEVDNIIMYFQQLEKVFTMNDPSTIDILNNHGIRSRLAFFKDVAQKKSRSVSMQMSSIANDDKVTQLNSAQQAAYLRSADTGTNARNMAKRALKQGLSFDVIARQEVKNLKKHLSQLNDIDDSEHYTSFYSQSTTLEGIKSVCELDDEHDTLNNTSALEILQLLNIVGIPCRGPVGDFPDPKTYHLEELMLGSFVSISDVLVVKELGSKLEDPFSKKEIINVIPFYDDDRIQQFLMKYAPTLLEYTASLGMRNMILDLPHTYKYTIVGGLWNMARRLDTEKTAMNVDVFSKLVLTYKTAVNGIFDYVINEVIPQSAEDKQRKLSYWISNNGTTNMISPMISLMEQEYNGNRTKSQFIPDILRALYSFEFYQVTRKFHRTDDDKVAKRKQILDDLLGIDYSKYGTQLPELYTLYDKNPVHHREAHPNKELMERLFEKVYWVDKMPLLPQYILQVFKGEEGKKNLLDMETVNHQKLEQLLDIDFSLDTFKYLCVIQSLFYDTKASRVDDEQKKMKITDCKYRDAIESVISDYVERQYRADYQSRFAQQEQREKEMLSIELVNNMLNTSSIEEYIKLFREGMKRNHVSACISDTTRLGFITLRDKILSPQCNVTLREPKLWIFIMGTTPNGSHVWNRGNVLRMSIKILEDSFTALNLKAMWAKMYPIYKERNVYIYRDSDKANRHTHCNSKASYWAMGYKTVGDYFMNINEHERREYMKIHTHCCGIWDGKLVRSA